MGTQPLVSLGQWKLGAWLRDQPQRWAPEDILQPEEADKGSQEPRWGARGGRG